MFATTPAERLATIATSRKSGAFGTFKDLGFGRSRVTGDGFDAFVSTNAQGWVVAPIGARPVGCDADLETAARFALEYAQ